MTHVSEGEKKMRENIESKVLRSLENFEEGFERDSSAFRTQNHMVKMTGKRLGRRGLGRGWEWMVKHLSMTKPFWGKVPFYFCIFFFF